MMGPGYGPGMMGNYGPGMMGGCPMVGISSDGQTLTFVDGRIAFLKAELGITDAQTSVWDAYAEAIKRNLQNMQGMWQTMKTVFEARIPPNVLMRKLPQWIAGSPRSRKSNQRLRRSTRP